MRSKRIKDKAYWAKHVESYRSGNYPSKRAYCLQAGIVYYNFLYWYAKAVKEQVSKDDLPQDTLFMPVQVAALQSTESPDVPLCTLELKQGYQLKIHSESVLEKLINLLGK